MTMLAAKSISRYEALVIAEACARLLRERFGAQRVIPFGSVRGDSPWRSDSDLDLAVEGLPPGNFFRAWSALREVLPRGLEVDLVSLEDAQPEMRARILKEAPMLSQPHAQLRAIIADELKTLDRVAQRMEEILRGLSEPPTWKDLTVIASLLHEFYNGVESIFERIADTLAEPKPRGHAWHADLLDQMAEARAGMRPAVIDESLRTRLEVYLRFRHFFRHSYGQDLLWSKMQLEAGQLAGTLNSFRNQLTVWLDKLTEDVTPGAPPIEP